MPIFGRFWPFLVIEKAHLQSQIQNHPRAQWRGVSRGEFDAMFSEVEVTSLSLGLPSHRPWMDPTDLQLRVFD